MRIGIFDPYLDDLGGGEKYMLKAASYLSNQHDVTLFWDNQQDIEALKKRFGISLDKITVKKNIFSSNVGFFEKLSAMQNYDAFVVLSDGSIPFVFPKKLYLHIQQPLPKHSLSFKERLKQQYISVIFYNSQFTKLFNDPLFPGVKASVIYPPVTIIESGKKDTKKENSILHVGRFRVKNLAADDYKKQGFMIDAFKQLIDKGLQHWKFLLASSVKKEDEEAFEQLQKSAKGYPIEFHINKTNKELFNFYGKAKIYWHASGYGEDLEEHPELAEHFGMSTVEAMGAGAVPVVINAGGQREIVTNGKDGLLWNTAGELLEKTNRLANDEKLRQELSKNAMIRALDFSEERFYHEVQRLISE